MRPRHQTSCEDNFMTMKNKLQHPLALIAQGFVAGAIIFYPATRSEAGMQRIAPTSSASLGRTDE
jgi:hypothetical protein